MESRLKSHLGLSRPYRFERTIAVAVALLLAGAGGAFVLAQGLAADVVAGSPRAWFFLYVGTLLAIGLVCAPWPRITIVVLSLAAVELGIGLGSVVLVKRGLAASGLMPEAEMFEPVRVWHPLLQAASAPTPPGKRTKYHIDSQGLRGRERSADELRARTVVALFGGSTTEDIAVPDGETWAERLEALLGTDRFAVLNHGVASNSTVQHVIRTAFYQGAYGVGRNAPSIWSPARIS